MKKNILTLMAAILVSAVAFVGCSEGNESGSSVADDQPLYWSGDACPITGNKYDSATVDEDGNFENSDIFVNFTHDGKDYAFEVWDKAAIATFNEDKEKFIAIIVANAK